MESVFDNIESVNDNVIVTALKSYNYNVQNKFIFLYILNGTLFSFEFSMDSSHWVA